MSRPPWARGLKSAAQPARAQGEVAPSVGAWIEIADGKDMSASLYVAPSVGAWIEIITVPSAYFVLYKSRPPWARGLKLSSLTRY